MPAAVAQEEEAEASAHVRLYPLLLLSSFAYTSLHICLLFLSLRGGMAALLSLLHVR